MHLAFPFVLLGTGSGDHRDILPDREVGENI